MRFVCDECMQRRVKRSYVCGWLKVGRAKGVRFGSNSNVGSK